MGPVTTSGASNTNISQLWTHLCPPVGLVFRLSRAKTSSCRNKDASIGFFFGDGTDDFGDGRFETSRKPHVVINSLPIIPDHLERVLSVSEECITDGRMDGPTDGQSLI